MQKKISAVLVDDESNSRIVLRSLLTSFFPEIEILAEASNADEAFELINRFSPQLVFLDIQMPGGDGFSLLKKWELIPFDVIFVTSFDQFAINAIRFSALDYLLKPIEVTDLRHAINKALRNEEQRGNNRILLENLRHSVSNETRERKIAVHVRDKVRLIPVAAIAYLLADASWSHLITAEGERYIISKNLKELEELLAEDSGFIRAHKSYIINVRFITEYSKGEPCMITMKDGKVFEIARRKKREILDRVNRM